MQLTLIKLLDQNKYLRFQETYVSGFGTAAVVANKEMKT